MSKSNLYKEIIEICMKLPQIIEGGKDESYVKTELLKLSQICKLITIDDLRKKEETIKEKMKDLLSQLKIIYEKNCRICSKEIQVENNNSCSFCACCTCSGCIKNCSACNKQCCANCLQTCSMCNKPACSTCSGSCPKCQSNHCASCYSQWYNSSKILKNSDNNYNMYISKCPIPKFFEITTVIAGGANISLGLQQYTGTNANIFNDNSWSRCDKGYALSLHGSGGGRFVRYNNAYKSEGEKLNAKDGDKVKIIYSSKEEMSFYVNETFMGVGFTAVKGPFHIMSYLGSTNNSVEILSLKFLT